MNPGPEPKHAPGHGADKEIDDHGVIGDLHSAALVGTDGSIDWYCYPHFDSPSVFAAILDPERGGHFRVGAAGETTRKQLYLPDTNVLITRFLGHDGVGEVTDYMPVDGAADRHRRHRIVRRVAAVRGSVVFRLSCRPAFDYARAAHEVAVGSGGALFQSKLCTLALAGRVPLRPGGPGVSGSFELREGESTTLVLEGFPTPPPGDALVLDDAEVERTFRATVEYWRSWLARSNYRGRWREHVQRSALTLKLLTFQPTGAIVAAPTCSLPEEVGGERNWDYRYVWLRDAAFTVYALMRIGFTEEAAAFMEWLQARIFELGREGALQPLYTIEGRPVPEEERLPHLAGYRGSRPVRVGNAAAHQLQLDTYGAIMDAVYLYNKHGTPISYGLWVHLRRMLDWLCENWYRPDSGIWEVRSGPQHFVHSRMMCWVALDRGIRLAEKRSFPADVARWRTARDAIYEEVMARGWSEGRQSFVQRYGSDALDASALLMPLVFFVSPTDPKMLKTLDAVRRELASDNLVHRYSLQRGEDGLAGAEGTFSLCTFWLVEALTRAGRLDDARMVFERMLGYANHLELYAEEVGRRGEALGNFPQAFTHLALISAAFNLDRAMGRG